VTRLHNRAGASDGIGNLRGRIVRGEAVRAHARSTETHGGDERMWGEEQDRRITAMPTRIVQVSIASLALVCTSVTLAGCAQQSSSTPFFTARGTLVQQAPASANAPGRPPEMQGVVGIHDGVYEGTANAIFTGAARCTATQTVTDFHVRNNVAMWAGYSGTIDPTGAVEMHRGFEFLTGRFVGNRFGGRLETGAWTSRPSCVYAMRLQRVGA